jgi:biofilm protein TabA
MIVDLLSQSHLYARIHPLFSKAFEFLHTFDPQTPDGRITLDGDHLFAVVQRYSTRPDSEKLWEAHRQYGDIQAVFSGEESCGHFLLPGLATTVPYQTEKDVEKFLPPREHHTRLALRPGCFAIFLPQDAHQPGVQLLHGTQILKVVIKFSLQQPFALPRFEHIAIPGV